MQEIVEEASSSELDEELAASNLMYELDDVRFCIKHCWKRLIENLGVVQFLIERHVLSQQRSPHPEPTRSETQAEAHQRAEINDINHGDLQTLLSQRLLSSQASRR